MNNNYLSLLNIPHRKALGSKIILIFMLIILFLTLTNEVYDKYTTYALYNNETLQLKENIINSDTILKSDFIKIDKQKYDYDVRNISDVNNNYQTFTLKIDNKYMENEVLEITFYKNKEKIIKKIIKVIF